MEEGKKENRSRGLWAMRLDEFLDEYRMGDMYMVASVPKEMAGMYMYMCTYMYTRLW